MLVEYKKLIKEYYDISDKYTNYDILQWAAASGYLDIVKILLKCKQIDPSKYNNLAMIWAIENGHLDIVDLLYEDERIDTEDDDFYNDALQAASENGHTDIEDFIFHKFKKWIVFYEPDEDDPYFN